MFTQLPLVSSSSRVAKILIPDGMADKIKQIRARFEEISQDRDNLHLREGDGERRILGPQNRPLTSSHIDEKGLFGREKEKEHIISLINPVNGPDFMVLPIVGKGGLGKTTLAQLVYNDSEVNRLFDKKAWVLVSEDFDLVRLTKAIIESITKNPCDFSELSQLQDVLKENLANIRLFLVLDDVWNEKNNLWESFRNVFNGAKAVKILATTRNYSVAKIMQTVQPFELGHLPEDKCWMIFKHHAFDNQEINTNLIEIGRDIVKKCKGLPLYVKVLGGLLRYETDEEKWREVLESETWIVHEKNDEIMSALSLSYYYLPLHLRSCFLYLSMFPKDTKLEKNMAVRLWMAHGYINTRPNETLEDIGCKYFEELRCRSLIDTINGNTYVLHDLIHDLAVSINDLNNDKSFPVYHLYSNKENSIPSYITTENIRCVRTLLDYLLHDPQINHPIILSMVCLRVLTLYVGHNELPVDISILKHLRYLKIKGFKLGKLPESLCVLYNLQILELDCYSLIELPTDIGNLIDLRHLLISSGEIVQLPESICNLYNLQTLKLGKLLEDLILENNGTKYPTKILFGLSLKSCSNFLPSLKFLVLETLHLDDMPEWNEWTGVLDDDLPCLKTLTIRRCLNLRKIPTIPKGLLELDIRECGLHEIRFPFSYTMKNMEILGCQELTSIIELNSQKSLRRLTLGCCPLLEIPVGGFLQSTTDHIMISDCPRINIAALNNICLYMRDDTTDSSFDLCPGVTSVLVCAKEVLSNPFLKHPEFKKCVALDLPLLEELKITNQWGAFEFFKGKLNAPLWCQTFEFVKHMCIIGCSKLRHWTDEYIPEMLELLQVSCCDELITIPVLDNNVSLLEIRVSNCPKLSAIQAQRCLFCLRTLFLKDCQELREMPSEMLKRRPQTVEISNCPGLKDWCQLNGITTNKDGEGSNSMIHCALSDTEGDVDTSLHL